MTNDGVMKITKAQVLSGTDEDSVLSHICVGLKELQEISEDESEAPWIAEDGRLTANGATYNSTTIKYCPMCGWCLQSTNTEEIKMYLAWPRGGHFHINRKCDFIAGDVRESEYVEIDITEIADRDLVRCPACGVEGAPFYPTEELKR